MTATFGTRVVGWALASAVVLAPAAAWARDLRFVTIDVAPWAFQDAATGQPSGVFPELIRGIEARTGFSIGFTLYPFARIDRELEAGTHDCTIIVWTDDRAAIVVKGELVSDHPMGVVARRGVSLTSYEDMAGLTVSILRGLSMGQRFDADARIRKDRDVDYEMGLRKIAHGRIDAIAGAIPTIRHLAEEAGVAGHLGDVLKLGTIPLVLQCAKSSQNLDAMPALNGAIQSMKDDGTLDDILRRHRFF